MEKQNLPICLINRAVIFYKTLSNNGSNILWPFYNRTKTAIFKLLLEFQLERHNGCFTTEAVLYLCENFITHDKTVARTYSVDVKNRATKDISHWLQLFQKRLSNADPRGE